MRNFIALLLSAFVYTFSSAQNPDLEIIWEEVEINPAVLPAIEAEIGQGAKTWRVYATFHPDYELQVIYGWTEAELNIYSSGPLYQHPDGGPTSLSVNAAFEEFVPSLAYDSWLTIGAESSQNNTLLISTVDDSFANWDAGQNLVINDIVGSALSVLYNPVLTQNRPDENGRVLLAQFTCAGSVSFCFNIQLRRLNPDGSIYLPLEIYQGENLCHTIQGTPDMCYNDFDHNGSIAMGDLLFLISNFSCEHDCVVDVNGDDKTNSVELTHFLAAFGQTCQ